MKVDYGIIKKDAVSNIFFLKNKSLWFFFSPKRKSRYFGAFLFFQGQTIRFLDDINFFDEIQEAYILSPNEVIFYLSQNHLYLNLKENSIEITLSNWQDINLTFDIKDIFKNDPWKRNIEIERISSNCLIVKEFFENIFLKILIEADSPLEVKNNWSEKKMDFDQERNSPPYSWWVFDGISGKIKELKIKILQPEIKEKEVLIVKNSNNNFINYLLNRINSLILDNYLPAGFSWFYQNWYRDELLTLYLIREFLDENFFNQRKIFYLSNLENIWDKNKIESSLVSADTFPLIVLNLDKTDLLTHFSILEKCLAFWKDKFIKNNEFDLPSYSTWMDTLERKKAIEIESLYLATLRKFAQLNKFYVDEANNLKEEIKKKIKSNINFNVIFTFLFLEDIFSLKEWEKIFDKLIKENYLEWGGISSISKNDPNFVFEDYGEITKAYHSGDSWYFMNNLIIYALEKINLKKYQKIIEKIFESSLNDLFTDGALGWSSEISSAKERKSQGSLVQTWSMSSLIFVFVKSQYLAQIFEKYS